MSMTELGKHHKDIKNIQFVLKARAKDATRPVLECILVTTESNGDRIAVCTDGFRMHIAYIDGIGDGLYQVIKATKTEVILVPYTGEAKFPDYKQLKCEYDRQLCTIDCTDPKIAIAAVNKHLPARLGIDYKYILDLDREFVVYYGAEESTGPIQFTNGSAEAWIMPLLLAKK